MQEPKEKQEPIDIQYELAKKKIINKIIKKKKLNQNMKNQKKKIKNYKEN